MDSADLASVTGTPTFFINGNRYYGAFDLAALQEAVHAAKAAPGRGGAVTPPGGSIAIVGGLVVPVEGAPIEGGTVLITDGKITAVGGAGLAAPAGFSVVDATGKWVLRLAGFDAHTHLGAHRRARPPGPPRHQRAHRPVQAHVRVLDAINPADEGFRDAVPGRAGGLHHPWPGTDRRPGRQAVRCWGRPWTTWCWQVLLAGMKSALGENPARVKQRRVNLVQAASSAPPPRSGQRW